MSACSDEAVKFFCSLQQTSSTVYNTSSLLYSTTDNGLYQSEESSLYEHKENMYPAEQPVYPVYRDGLCPGGEEKKDEVDGGDHQPIDLVYSAVQPQTFRSAQVKFEGNPPPPTYTRRHRREMILEA